MSKMRSIFFASALLCGLATLSTQARAQPAASAAAIPYDDAHAITYAVVAPPLTEPSAPADEYFGRFKLSNLGIRNIIHDITIEGNSPLALPKQVGRLQSVQGALADWADKYPRDRWLPGTIVRFATLLQSKQQPLYDQAAISLDYLLLERYPNTWFSKFALSTLRKFDEHAPMDMLAAPDVNDPANVIDYDFARPR